MLKILQISNKVPFPPKDGGALAVLNMAEGLSQLGMEVSLLTFNTSKHHQASLSIDPSKHPYRQIWAIDLNTSIDTLSAIWNFFSSSKAYHLKRFWSKEFCDQLTQILSSQHFDLIQFEALYMLQYSPIIRHKSPCPIAYRAHNIEHQIWNRKAKNESNLLKKVFFKDLSRRIKKYETECSSLYDFLIAISPKDLEFFNSTPRQKPSFLAPAGMKIRTLSQDKAATGSSPLDLFYIGALDWLPNQEGLLWFLKTCWDTVRQKRPELTLHIAGRNAPIQLENKIRAYKNVIYHGEVEDASQYMQEHGILLVPLFSGSGMRVKIAEAMALGKTVITSSIGIEGIGAADGHEVLIADTADRWIALIEKTVCDPSFCRQIGLNASFFANEHLDLNRISKKIINFYTNHIV